MLYIPPHITIKLKNKIKYNWNLRAIICVLSEDLIAGCFDMQLIIMGKCNECTPT